jgi:hypothetical protein
MFKNLKKKKRKKMLNLIYLYKNKKEKNLKNWEIPKRLSAHKLRIRFIVPAQEAKAVAPLAPIFGQFGLNCPDFCKQFNEKTVTFEPGLILIVYLDIMFDRTFRFSADKIYFTELMVSSAESNLLGDQEAFYLVLVYMYLFKTSFVQSLETVGGTFRASRLKLRPHKEIINAGK